MCFRQRSDKEHKKQVATDNLHHQGATTTTTHTYTDQNGENPRSLYISGLLTWCIQNLLAAHPEGTTLMGPSPRSREGPGGDLRTGSRPDMTRSVES